MYIRIGHLRLSIVMTIMIVMKMINQGLSYNYDHAYDRDDHDHLVVGLRSPSVRKSAISPPRFADLSIVVVIVYQHQDGRDQKGDDEESPPNRLRESGIVCCKAEEIEELSVEVFYEPDCSDRRENLTMTMTIFIDDYDQ